MIKKINKSSITFNIKLSKEQFKDDDEDDAPLSKKSKSNKSKSVKPDPEEEESKPVMKSVIKKGLAPVDSECPDGDNYRVFCEGRDIWDVMLNQTNIQQNNNKFYLIQLLQNDNNGSFAVWMRWGRVGYKGQTNFTSFGNDKERAKSTFCKKFSDKTKNDWDDRDSFEKCPGKYDLVKIDYNNTKPVDDESDAVDGPTEKLKEEPVESKLPKSVQDLISLICNIKTMEEAVIEMKYDTKKAPLGKITVEQIKAGYLALKKISECVEEGKTNGNVLIQACNDFYTRIPHEFGFKTPPIIKSAQEVKKKLELLKTLSDIQVALKILSSVQDNVNPIDSKYNQLKIDISPMDKKTKEWKTVEIHQEYSCFNPQSVYHGGIGLVLPGQEHREQELQGLWQHSSALPRQQVVKLGGNSWQWSQDCSSRGPRHWLHVREGRLLRRHELQVRQLLLSHSFSASWTSSHV